MNGCICQGFSQSFEAVIQKGNLYKSLGFLQLKAINHTANYKECENTVVSQVEKLTEKLFQRR